MSPTARRQVILSDLSGNEVEEVDAAQLIFRRGKGIDRPVTIDVILKEVDDLTDAPNIYLCEIKPFMGEGREVVVTEQALKKLVPDGDLDVLLTQSARGTRGRPKLTR